MARKKLGRNKEFCKRYKAEGRREKNKKIKLLRHIKKYPEDKQAAKVLGKLT